MDLSLYSAETEDNNCIIQIQHWQPTIPRADSSSKAKSCFQTLVFESYCVFYIAVPPLQSQTAQVRRWEWGQCGQHCRSLSLVQATLIILFCFSMANPFPSYHSQIKHLLHTHLEMHFFSSKCSLKLQIFLLINRAKVCGFIAHLSSNRLQPALLFMISKSQLSTFLLWNSNNKHCFDPLCEITDRCRRLSLYC